MIIVNIKQIARKAGVSVATVSRVLNHPETVSQRTKKKVEQVIEEEEYTPNWFARGLNFDKTGTIGLMIPHILNSVHMETARGVEDVAHQKGYITFMCNVEGDPEKEKRYLDQLIKRRVDGIILISSTLNEENIKNALGQKVPMVSVGSNKYNSGLSTVSVDCKLGAEKAVKHLIENGCKKVAILCNAEKSKESMDKLIGYKAVLEENNMDIEDKYISYVENTIEGGYLAAKKMAELKEPPDAIFSTSDIIAFGAMDAIKDKGLKIPEDIAFMGFDNIRLSNLVEPKLSTIDVPLHKMGIYGARLLFDIIENESANEIQRREILLETKLKIRKSCRHKERIGEMF